MMGLYLLIPLSVLLVFIIGVIFWWSVRSGQYDDMEGPAYRLLMDDRDAPARSAAVAEPADAAESCASEVEVASEVEAQDDPPPEHHDGLKK
ncbi:cbb3-type cytochrome oxidase assembly protein CcoS [Rhodocyclaceae bacterium SMB388]